MVGLCFDILPVQAQGGETNIFGQGDYYFIRAGNELVSMGLATC